MKNIRLTALAIVLALLLAGVAACGDGKSSSSSSSSSHTTSSSSSSKPSSSSSTLPSSSSASDSMTQSSSSVPTLSTDFSQIGALSGEKLGWGPGGPVDGENRSQGSLLYQDKYGKYNAVFISDDTKNIYLTFDEGYEYGLSGSILDTLKEKNVKAIFFVTKYFAESQPALVRRMIDEGHVVGNHSYAHKDYPDLTLTEAVTDLMDMHDYIKENFGYDMKYFRFPSGNFSEQTLAAVQQCGYRSVFWSFAYKDWLTDAQPDPEASRQKIVKAACPGMVYLLHAVSSTNAGILGDVIDEVAAAGYVWADPNQL